jgi:hypothetical protein
MPGGSDGWDFKTSSTTWQAIPNLALAVNYPAERVCRATLQGHAQTTHAMSVAVLLDGQAVDARGGRESEPGFLHYPDARTSHIGYGHTYSHTWTQVTAISLFKLSPGPHTIGAAAVVYGAGNTGEYNAAYLTLEVLPVGTVWQALP